MARSKKRVTERRLVDVLVSHLRKGRTVAREVPHYEKRIDVVTVDPESGKVCAIEAKTAAWERAIGQAVVNLTAANVSLYSDLCPVRSPCPATSPRRARHRPHCGRN